jgi:GH15 family glucan-1,4-alpha-glucosidase
MSHSESMPGSALGMVRDFADYVCENWRRPDAGIWERRNDLRHWVHSKVMACFALERALELGSRIASEGRRTRWASERDAIAEDIVTYGWDAERRTYLRSYGTTDLDAALLSPPLFAFEKDRERLATTVQAIRDELSAGGPLLYRYRRPEGEGEGAFLPCSFWLVQALTRIGRLKEAEDLFGQACALTNDLGLLPEQIAPDSGDFLGNFPLAFTHATLVQAALELEAARR